MCGIFNSLGRSELSFGVVAVLVIAVGLAILSLCLPGKSRRTKVMVCWICFTAVTVPLFSPASVVAGESLCLQGITSMRAHTPSGMVEAPAKFFTINVQDCNWFLRFLRDPGTNTASAPDYEEVSFDGESVYYLYNMQSAVTLQRKKGAELAPNIAVGTAFNGQVPYIHFAFEVSPIWLTCASVCYFKSRTNDMVEPGMVSDFSGRTYGAPNHFQLRAQWSLSDSKPQFATRVVYFDDGYIFTPQGFVKRPSPYSDGFTNAIFQVRETTNFNGLVSPRVASLEIFRPRVNGNSSTELDCAVEYWITLTNAELRPAISAWQPVLPGITSIKDERYGVLNYFGSNDWPSIDELRTGRYFSQLRSINKPHAPAAASGRVRVLVRVLFVLLLLGPCAFYFRWKLIHRRNANL